MNIETALAEGAPPIIAILRGIEPHEAVDVASALVEAGIRLIEVPFNSPDAASSIRAMAKALGTRAAIGGGTVVRVDEAEMLAEAGGTFMVSPNTDPAVIARSVELGLDAVPGFLTPTEAFAAIHAGATDLKLFPGSVLGSGYVRAVNEVLPRNVRIWAVGGIGADNLAEFRHAGVFGIGVGGSLYRPGDKAEAVGERAQAMFSAWSPRAE